MSRGRPANYGILTVAARKAGMTRRAYALHLIAVHGSPRAAAAFAGVGRDAITRAIRYKPTGRNKIMMLADRAVMTTRAFVRMTYEDNASCVQATADRLGVSTAAIHRYLKDEKMLIRGWKPIPALKRQKIIQLLRDGFRVGDVARLTGMKYSTVSYWYKKLEQAKATMRRLGAARKT